MMNWVCTIHFPDFKLTCYFFLLSLILTEYKEHVKRNLNNAESNKNIYFTLIHSVECIRIENENDLITTKLYSAS